MECKSEKLESVQRKKLTSSNIVFIGDRNETPGSENLSGQSGQRLANMLALDLSELLTMQRENIYEMDTIPVDVSSRRKLLKQFADRYLVLLGVNAQRIVLGEAPSPLTISKIQIDGKGLTCWVLSLPHPSGRNRWYNSEGNRELAATTLRAFIKLAQTEVER